MKTNHLCCTPGGRWAFVAGCVLTLSSLARPNAAQEPAGALTLRNDRLVLTVSRLADQGVTSLVDRKTGLELTPPRSRKPLFVLCFHDNRDAAGAPIFIAASQAESLGVSSATTQGRTTATLEFKNLAGRRIEATCTVQVSPVDPFVHWRLSARFQDPLVLDSVLFPQLVFRAPLVGGGTNDAVVMGATKGGVYRRPDKWKAGTRINVRQPGTLAAQFACYYGAKVGMFTACRDVRGYPKEIDFRRSPADIETFWTHRCFASHSFRLPYEVVMTTFTSAAPDRPTDWRDAADLYKEWAARQPWCARTYAERTDIPWWLKAGPAMARFNRSWLAKPATIDRWLRDYWRKFFADAPPLITAYWGWEKVDTWVTPDYFPLFPSDEEFKKLAARNKALGCHAFLWPSGYHYTLTYNRRNDGTFAWDDRDRFYRSFAQHAARVRSGKLFLQKASWLRGGEHASMCPGDPWTLDWFNHTATELAKRGAELIQVDQVVGGSFPPCYSTTHGHPPGPGVWMTDVFHTQLRTMREQCRKIQPDAVVCFEEPNEFFLQDVGIQDYRDWQVTRRRNPKVEPASVFNYLYHEYVPTFQSNPRANDRRMEAYCLVNGEIPHLVPSRLVGAGPALVNGGFEVWTHDAPDGWTRVPGYQGEVWRGKCYRDASERRSGAAGLRLENANPEDVVQVSQNVPVGGEFRIGRTYRLTAWMKTGALTKRNALALAGLTSTLKVTGGWRIPFPAVGRGWVKGAATFVLPPDTDFLRVMLYVRGKGCVWIDDVSLEEVHPDGSTTVVQRPETPPDHDFMTRWVELFAGKGRPYLLFGRMLHPPPLEMKTTAQSAGPLPPVLHNAYRAPDGTEAVVLVNTTDNEQTGVLQWRGRSLSVTLKPWEAKLVRDR